MAGEYIGHRGALFKKKPEGGYYRVVFCPTCKGATPSLADMLHFYCPHCNWRSNFTGRQLHTVMEKLPDADEGEI
jgi:hypothetical protein